MRIGVLGGNELARMLGLAGITLGHEFRFFDPSPDAPARAVGPLVCAEYTNRAALNEFIEGLDLCTYVWEHVPSGTVKALAEQLPLYPSARALEVAQDRLVEKQFFAELGIKTPAFLLVNTFDHLTAAVKQLGYPVMLKTRRMGEDGQQQLAVRTPPDIGDAWKAFGGVPLIAEEFINYEREMSVIGTRDKQGTVYCYELTENHYRNGMLSISMAPAPGHSDQIQKEAEQILQAVAQSLNYVGTLAIEFFQHQDKLIAGELVPLVHNSGHWTIEGANTSQFTNHIRAITGLSTGCCRSRGYSAMINLVGDLPDLGPYFASPDVRVHLYGKTPAPGRKMGHVTMNTTSAESANQWLAAQSSGPLTFWAQSSGL